MITVLYVDNNPENLPFIVHLCEQNGSIDIHPVSSGEEAQLWLMAHVADLVISEYDLPGVTGLELLESLRARGLTTPFIFFTRNMSPLVRYKAHQMGVFGYIIRDGTGKKPVMQLMRLLNWSIQGR